MIPKPGPDEREVGSSPDFQVSLRTRGDWLLVTLSGICNDSLLGVLYREVFSQKQSLAIDTAGLSGITPALARELYLVAGRLKPTRFRLVLINPGEKILGLIRLIAADARIPTFASFDDLPEDPRELEQQIESAQREREAIRRNLQTRPVWQLADRENAWLCPFCARTDDQVRLVSRVQIPDATVEAVYRHLRIRCQANPAISAAPRPEAELKSALQAINELKLKTARSFAAALETRVRVLEDKAQRADSLEQGLKIAVDRQRRLLPQKPPEIPGCEIALIYRPAQSVSGDFYDFIDLGSGRVGISIGDVSGHGIEAGILMGMTKKILAIRALEMQDPAAALRRANVDIYPDLDRQTFVTAFLAMYEPATRKIVWGRAGHNPPILFNPRRRPPSARLEAGGMMLGMSAGALFEKSIQTQTTPLGPGDLLLLYTDGLEEAKNASGECFGLERVRAVLESESERAASYILGALSFALDRFCGSGPPEDDITAICLKIL